MTPTPTNRPPRIAESIVRLVLRDRHWTDVEIGDLREEFAGVAAARGLGAARAWYWRQAFALIAESAAAEIRKSAAALSELVRPTGDHVMRTLFHEARFAVRGLIQQPLVTAIVVVTLAFGLGANAATFGMIDSLILRPFTIRDVDRLVVLSENSAEDPFPQEAVSPANFLDFQRQADVFDAVASFDWRDVNLAGADRPERIQGFGVSGEFFHLMAIVPAHGRLLDAVDAEFGRHRQVVIGDGLWHRRFGGDPAAVGRAIRVDGEPHVIVGIAPKGFDFPSGSEMWMPLVFSKEDAANRTNRYLTTIARLKPGTTLEQAQARMDAIYASLTAQHPEANSSRQLIVRTFTDGMIDVGMTQILGLWQAAAALVLLIGCTNVANLLLARGAARHRELAVRLAIGASRGRLIRQLLIESVVLALVAAPAALVVAIAAFGAIRAAMPPELAGFVPGWTRMGVDARVAAFTIAASILTAVVFGLLPAVQSSRPVLTTALRDGGRSVSTGLSRSRLRRGLVVAEIALALPLLIAAGLAAVGAQRFASGPQGYDPNGVLQLRVILPDATYPDATFRRQFAERLVEQAARIPGVEAAATTSALPASGSYQTRRLEIDGRPVDPHRPLTTFYRAISPDYLRVLRIPLQEGRTLSERDRSDTERVALVSRSFANQFWPDGSAIGRRIRLGIGESAWTTIVGVAGNTIDDWFSARNAPTVYVPVAQLPSAAVSLVIRTSGDPETLADDARLAVAAVDPMQPAFDVKTMNDALFYRTTGLRFIAALMAVFGALALVLAAVGIYSVMAYFVAQRRHEIGIRLALGATARDVVRLTVGHGGRMTAIGIVLGVAAGVLLARVMENLLFGIVALEPWLFGSIVLLLALVAVAASLLPARQAVRVDPVAALRAE